MPVKEIHFLTRPAIWEQPPAHKGTAGQIFGALSRMAGMTILQSPAATSLRNRGPGSGAHATQASFMPPVPRQHQSDEDWALVEVWGGAGDLK